jgi:hypothetical protein
MAATPYGAFLSALFAGQLDYQSDTFKLMLATASYTPNVDTDTTVDQVVAAEASGTGYTPGGATLTGLDSSYDAVNDWTVITADPVSFTGATVSFRYAVIYRATAAQPQTLIGYIDVGSTQTITNNDFGFSFPNGLIRFKRTA